MYFVHKVTPQLTLSTTRLITGDTTITVILQ